MTVNEFVDKSFEPFQLHIKELEKQIKELEQSLDNLTVAYETLKLHDEEEISLLQAQIEKLKSCSNCIHYSSTFGLCHYSMGDEDYDCRGRKWEIKEK